MSKSVFDEAQACFDRLHKIHNEQTIMMVAALVVNSVITVMAYNSRLCVLFLSLNCAAFWFCGSIIRKESRAVIARIEEIAEQEISDNCSTQEKVRKLVDEMARELDKE